MNGNRRFACALLVCVVAIFAGCRGKTESGDGKAQIFKYLSKKSHQKQFTPGIDLELRGQVTSLASNALVLEQHCAELRAALKALKSEPFTDEAKRGTQNTRQSSLERELKDAEQQWQTARREAARKQQELSQQDDTYIRAMRRKISEARNYELLYQFVGEELATADRFLAEPDRSRQRIGLKLAREACNHAKSSAMDVWLAGRICEAYFWPNLDVADPKPGSRDRLELLETSRRVFFETDETNSVLKNYSLLMSNAPDAKAADTFRVQLADWLEEKHNAKFAAQVLDEIRDAEVLASAQERITRVRTAASASH
jgi:hypothetical protein